MSGPSWVTCTGEANLTARLPGGRQVRGKTQMAVDQRVGQATPAPCGTSDVSRSIAVRVRPPRNTGLSILTVSVVTRTLQTAGLIQQSRGGITVTDRAGLEAAACECYGRIRRLYQRLLPGTF